jgi:glucose/mannose-6-phosphate isomerase
MSDVLDNANTLNQRDPEGALKVSVLQYEQARFEPVIEDKDNDGRPITAIVFTGMGGSALAALVANVWLRDTLKIPFEVIRGYDLPAYVDPNTLVIADSYSGNTEETLSTLDQAEKIGAQIGVITSGGKLLDIAADKTIARIQLPGHVQPRMTVIYNLKALIALLENFGVLKPGNLNEIAGLSGWLESESAHWAPDIPTDQNYAKQLAEEAVGKTPIFYGGALTAPLAYKWKISWNENAKNVAFWNEYPEFNHNEFIGWTSHPVEKPFAVFDLVSNLEHPQILKRFELSDRLLSGKRPKATSIQLAGETAIAQLLWGAILADFTSIYVAILNGVDPTPVDLVEKLKKEL